MGEVLVMICHSGMRVTSDKEKEYLLENVSKITCCGANMITLGYSIPMGSHENKLVFIGDDSDMQYFLEYSLVVIGTRVTPIYVSMLHISSSMNKSPTKVPLWSDETFEVTSTLVGKQRVLGTTEVPFEDGDDIDWVTMVDFESWQYIFDLTVVTIFTTQNVMSMADNKEGGGAFRIAKDEVFHQCDLALLKDRHLQVNTRLIVYSAEDVMGDVKTTLGSQLRDLVAKYLNDVGVKKWSQAQMNGKRYNIMTTNIAAYFDSIYLVFLALHWNAKRAGLPSIGKVRRLKHKLKQYSYEDSVSRFKVSKELEIKKKKAYEGEVELLRVYANLHNGAKANKDWLDVDMTNKPSLLRRHFF
ncbi:S ribonuclease [Pyrus ussuriensis x Pyrus communis]|uniref:S ribonuclease n=1 Tax=Pyrus ussuriensis x Pyrus communis TaxID=2448454 RepID=A0A5N5GPB2_9ROSA|nr:S ribonuclease [Pyrus ussuriensis x Pyrus communis]